MGKVNRDLLESFYQNKGDFYDDDMTEGAFGTLADTIDANWEDYKDVKDTLNSSATGASGAEYVKSEAISGLTGNNVRAQMVSLKGNLDASMANVLQKDNTTAYTPTGPYHPSTKGYVDQVAQDFTLGIVPDWMVKRRKTSVVPSASSGYVRIAEITTESSSGNDSVVYGTFRLRYSHDNNHSVFLFTIIKKDGFSPKLIVLNNSQYNSFGSISTLRVLSKTTNAVGNKLYLEFQTILNGSNKPFELVLIDGNAEWNLIDPIEGGIPTGYSETLAVYSVFSNDKQESSINFGSKTVVANSFSGSMSSGQITSKFIECSEVVAYNAVVINANNPRRISVISGSPEGVLSGNVGDIAIRYDGGVKTTQYNKESGTGNTGWKAVQTA